MASFPVQAVLSLRDLFSDRLKRIFLRAERDAAKSGDKMGDNLRKGITKRVAGGVRRLAGGVLATVGLGAGAGFAAAGSRVRDFEETLEDTRVQANATRAQADALRDSIKQISDETKVSRAEVLAGAESLVNLSGQAGFAADKLDVLARAEKASKAGTETLAKVWDGLNKAFFEGEGSAEDMEGALSAAIEAGKQGSIPLSEMGTLLGRVATQFDDVSFAGKTGVADMVAALQVVKGRGFGEASEAATGMNSAIKSLIARSSVLKKEFDTDVFDIGPNGTRRLKDMRSILDQLKKSVGTDPLKLQEALKDAEAIRFVGALLDDNVRKKWDDIADAATTSNAVQDDFAAKQTSNAAKINAAMVDMENTMDDALSPERLKLFADALNVVVSGLSAVVDGLEDVGEGIGKAAGATFEFLRGDEDFLSRTSLGQQLEQGRFDAKARTRAAAGAALVRGGTRLDPDALAEARAVQGAQKTRSGFADPASAELTDQQKAILELAAQGVPVAERTATEQEQLAQSLSADVQTRTSRVQDARRTAAAGPVVPRELSIAAAALADSAQKLKASADQQAANAARTQLDQLASSAPPTGAR